MLSSTEGFSYQGFDIDSISDITSISMSKMDFVEQGSQHSGSFGSDNTDALLNASLRDFEGDESLLESVSQVGADLGTPYKRLKDRIASHGGKQQGHSGVWSEGFSVNAGTHEVAYVHGDGMPEAFSTSQNKGSVDFHGIQDGTSIQHSQSFEQNKNFDQGFNSKRESSGNLRNEATYMPRKFSSDSDSTISGRESVIKHHSSLPSMNPESEAKATNFDRKQGHYVNGNRQCHTDQYLMNPHSGYITDAKCQIKPTTGNGSLPWGQSGLIRDNTQYMRDINDHHGTAKGDLFIHDGQNMSRHGHGNIGDVYSNGGTIRDINVESRGEYDRHLGTNNEDFDGSGGMIRGITDESRHEYNGHSANQKFGSGHEAKFISGTAGGGHNRDGFYEGRGHEEMSRNKDSLQDSSIEQRQTEEMLLGVKHDPETNELYDDKVREGADLLSKLLGGDHNASFTSHSSRSSERNAKSSSFREKASLNKQRSLDSSVHSEARLPRSSSPKNSISRDSDKSGKLKSSSSRGDQVPLRHHRSLDSLNTDARFHENFSPKHYDRPLHADSRSYVNAKEGMDASKGTQNEQRNKPGTLIHDSAKLISRSEEEARINSSSLESENGQKEYNFLENGDHLLKSESARDQGLNAVPSEGTDLKQLELDMEEILSRKKMAAHELQILEESLQRNKADMKSSESLVEQYRWQATRARSELMDLEKRRSQLQEECTALDGVLKKSKQKETFNSDEVIFGRSKDEIFRALQEREQFKQGLDSMQETLKREQRKAKVAQDDLRVKVRSLEGELSKQHEETVKNLQMMKEQLHNERQKVRALQQDKFNAVNKIHDQIKEQKEKENETLKTRMLRERKSHIEILEEKLKRETNQWKRATENGELRIKQLEESLFERNDELDKVRKQLREEKQKNLDIEKQWRSQLESERQDADIKYDGQERSWKDREEKLVQQLKELENLVEERTTDFRRSEERCRSQTEELQKIIENKNEEMKMVRGLVRQQEDATRVLGERLRNEAREHVRNAVEKERQSLHKEKERVKRAIDDGRDKHDRIVKQMTEQLDIEKERHSQTKDILNKLKQEGDDLRKQVVEAHGERITCVQRARQENGEELGKIKEKLHEFTVQADKLEKIDQETAKAIYEECRKIAEMVDMPLSYKTPTRFSDEQSGGNATRESPTKEALASLRQCNDELRQRLSDMKKQMAKQSTQTDHANKILSPKSRFPERKKNFPPLETSLTSNSELAELRTRLAGKEEEIERLQRKHNEEIEKLKDEKKKEQLSYRRTITKLEQEFQKLVATKTSSTSYKTKRDISRSTITTSSNGVTQSPNVNPASRSVQKSSSADLLKHLQDRVKKLRAENENLKKSSDKETLARNTRHSESALLQSNGLTISQLRTPTKGRGSMSDNIEQVSRIQKLLASTTKDD